MNILLNSVEQDHFKQTLNSKKELHSPIQNGYETLNTYFSTTFTYYKVESITLM